MSIHNTRLNSKNNDRENFLKERRFVYPKIRILKPERAATALPSPMRNYKPVTPKEKLSSSSISRSQHGTGPGRKAKGRNIDLTPKDINERLSPQNTLCKGNNVCKPAFKCEENKGEYALNSPKEAVSEEENRFRIRRLKQTRNHDVVLKDNKYILNDASPKSEGRIIALPKYSPSVIVQESRTCMPNRRNAIKSNILHHAPTNMEKIHINTEVLKSPLGKNELFNICSQSTRFQLHELRNNRNISAVDRSAKSKILIQKLRNPSLSRAQIHRKCVHSGKEWKLGRNRSLVELDSKNNNILEKMTNLLSETRFKRTKSNKSEVFCTSSQRRLLRNSRMNNYRNDHEEEILNKEKYEGKYLTQVISINFDMNKPIM